MRRRGNRFKARTDRDRALHDFDLDVRTRRLNRQRSRASLLWLTRVCLAVVIVATLGASLRWIYRQVFIEDTEFRVQRFMVESDGDISESEVSEITGVTMGSPLMSIDLEAVCRRLEAVPSVRSAKVERELPGTLKFSILENQPLAWLSCPPHGIRPYAEGGYLLTGEGLLMQCSRSSQLHRALPVIEVFQIPPPADGIQIPGDGIKVALLLLKQNEEAFPAMADMLPQSVRLKTPFSLSCRYANNMEVTYGLKDLDRALKDLKLIMEVARNEGKKLATVNLLASRNIPVTYFQAEEQPRDALRATPVLPLAAPDSLPVASPKLSSILNRD